MFTSFISVRLEAKRNRKLAIQLEGLDGSSCNANMLWADRVGSPFSVYGFVELSLFKGRSFMHNKIVVEALALYVFERLWYEI